MIHVIVFSTCSQSYSWCKFLGFRVSVLKWLQAFWAPVVSVVASRRPSKPSTFIVDFPHVLYYRAVKQEPTTMMVLVVNGNPKARVTRI